MARLRSGIKPFRLYWYSRLRSTNDHAAALRKRGDLFAPAAVLTGHQTAGRGRGHHRWWSGPGCLTVTFVFPINEQIDPHQLPLVAGLAVRNAASELSGNDAIALKWPNDLLFEGRKLGGLLCERVWKADLVGLGLNVNLDIQTAPAELRGGITTLRQITGAALDMTRALATVARHLHQMWSGRLQYPFPALLKDYDAHHALIGRRVSVIGNDARLIRGRCEGLDGMGRLLLREKSKLQRVISGQVKLL